MTGEDYHLARCNVCGFNVSVSVVYRPTSDDDLVSLSARVMTASHQHTAETGHAVLIRTGDASWLVEES